MSNILTQDDYKRFEELIEQMIEERTPVSKGLILPGGIGKRVEEIYALKKTLQLIKERQNLTLKS